MDDKIRPRRPLRQRLRSVIFDTPFFLPTYLASLLWGFRLEGEDNFPEGGPCIILYSEPGMLGLALSGFLAIKVLRKVIVDDSLNNMSMYHEELFRVAFFKRATLSEGSSGHYAPLVPHSAPQMARGLLDAYRVLMNNGVVQTNPSGDAPWDGRPIPFGRAVAWLALRTAAPIVLLITPIGAYEIWPRWQFTPSRKGRMKIAIPEPFRLCDEPLERVTDEDIAEANARLFVHHERALYGPDGAEAWVGPVLRNGQSVTEPVQLHPPAKPLAAVPPRSPRSKVSRWGVAQLLWQCPVCRTNEALIHRRPRFRPETVICQACGTLWDFQRLQGHDFRMKVMDGPADLVGLDMPVSTWYEHMKRNFSPTPIEVAGVDLLPGEEVYLEAHDIPLAPYRPNPIFDGWTGRQPPKTQADWLEIAGWETIGEGRLLVTDRRLVWEGERGALDFLWSEVAAVSHYPISTIAIHYGTAKYRFNLGNRVILKWLHYTGELAIKAAAQEGRSVSVTHH